MPYVTRPASSCSTNSSSSLNGSEHSESTVPTVHSNLPAVKRHNVSHIFDPHDSAFTYASTVASSEDLPDEPRYEVVNERHEMFPSDAVPSNPTTFAELFPSLRRLLIRHDDTTIDGNMNLRVDTLAPQADGYQQAVILFHLRMHDLHTRKFSFRRYCRDSGREVCHSSRKFTQPTIVKRPALHTSLSSVLSSLRPGSSGGVVAGLKRRDSMAADDDAILDEIWPDSGEPHAVSTNSISLEFSNYAHVEIRRRGSKRFRRYEFEYWSNKYQWRRESRKEGEFKSVSYHLINMDTAKSVALIVAEALTPLETVEEESKGGWVPSCSFWLNDPSIWEKAHDLADVVVATGLITLVDDSIRRRWHNKRHVLLTLPKAPSFMKNVDAISPKKLIDEMFHRHQSMTPPRKVTTCP